MGNWDDLATEATALIRNAQVYLSNQRADVQSPMEQVRIEDLSKQLEQQLYSILEVVVTYKGTPAAAVAPHDQPTYEKLSEDFALFDQRLKQQQGKHDLGLTQSIMGGLIQHLGAFMMAGPNGPGGGKP
ncbi:MAG TPA: hypothetical protein VMO17_20555 [Terriglobia bacterium]|nr:hypothetical protein [Terriglobia bacterium]